MNLIERIFEIKQIQHGWVGVDLDGTLAYYNGWKADLIGPPIPEMVGLVLELLDEGITVKIFTARAADPTQTPAITAWCIKHLGRALEVTNIKDKRMELLLDDKALGVVKNTGQLLLNF